MEDKHYPYIDRPNEVAYLEINEVAVLVAFALIPAVLGFILLPVFKPLATVWVPLAGSGGYVYLRKIKHAKEPGYTTRLFFKFMRKMRGEQEIY